MSRKSTFADTQDRYTPDAGTVEGPCYCGVCDAIMDENRNSCGSRTFMEAMSKYKSSYDSFTCPHIQELWHRQVIELRKKAREHVSARLACIMLEEVEEILEKRTATKETGGWIY